MKSRTIAIIGFFTAILMTASGGELALARGGGGKGEGSYNRSGSDARMPKAGKTYQHQSKQQNQYQYRQNNGIFATQSRNGQMHDGQNNLRTRTQLRDPDSPVFERSK